MRKTVMILAACLLSVSALAGDRINRLRYWCHLEGVTCSPDCRDVVAYIATRNGRLSWVHPQADEWKIGNPPTQEALDNLSQSAVDAWIAAQKAESEAEAIYDGDTGVLLQAFAIELKKVNSGMNLPSKADVIAKYKELKGE